MFDYLLTHLQVNQNYATLINPWNEPQCGYITQESLYIRQNKQLHTLLALKSRVFTECRFPVEQLGALLRGRERERELLARCKKHGLKNPLALY